MDAPAVTIVVPVFGTEKYLNACLESILRQTFRNFEVIVVDDCSPGDVAEIVGRVAETDPRVRLIRHDVNRGEFHARFTGLREARGEYLGFVDSDDEVEDFFIEVMYSAAKLHDADIVDCAFVIGGPDERLVNRGGSEHVLRGPDILRGVLAGSMSNSAWSKLTRLSTYRSATAALEQGSPRNIFFIEDLLCLVHVAIASECLVHVSSPGYRYLPRSGGRTNTDDVASLLRNLQNLDYVYSLLRGILESLPLPSELVDEFFRREFLSIGQDLLLQMADLPIDTPSGLPRAVEQLGLMGAVAVAFATAGRL